MNKAPSWSEFEQRAVQPATASVARDRFCELCATMLSGGIGADFLQALRAMTIERRMPPTSTEAELREIEAQRRFVSDLERDRDRGLELLSRKSKPTA